MGVQDWVKNLFPGSSSASYVWPSGVRSLGGRGECFDVGEDVLIQGTGVYPLL